MRIRASIVIGVLAVLLTATVAWAGDTFEGFQIVRVMLNNQEVVGDVPAINFHGRTLLPLRKIAELAGLTVDRWDPETNTAYLSGGKAEAVATVNGQPITKEDLYNRLVQANGTKSLEQLIVEALIRQEAAKNGITVTAEELDQEMAKIRANFESEAEFQATLKQNGLTVEQVRASQAMKLNVRKLMTRQVTVTDEALVRFFQANQNQFDQRTAHARHILVGTEAEAKAIKAELDQGADFSTLAKERSIDPSAKSNGGDLGTFGLGAMVPAFEKVVFSLKAGETSAPFATDFGWHVVQVLQINGAAPDFVSMKEQIRQTYLDVLVQNQFPLYLEQLRAKATIQNNLK